MKTLLAVGFGVCLAATAATQAAPKLLPFQGRLTDQNGAAISDGVRLVQFKIYDAPVGGQAMWNGEVQKLSVNGGLVNTVLGSKASLSSVDFNKSLYLELTIDANDDGQITAADPPLLPRQSILPTVFAAEAAIARDSHKLSGNDWTPLFGMNDPSGPLLPTKIADGSLPASKLTPASITAAQIASQAVTAEKIAPQTITANQIAAQAITSTQIADGAVQSRHIGAINQLSASDGNPSAALVVDSEGRVGIGTGSPQAKLDIAGTLQIAALAQQSLGSNGYVKIGELIIQWGQEMAEHDIVNPDRTSVNFPIPFPNQVLVVVPGMYNAPNTGFAALLAVESASLTQVTFQWNELASTGQRLRATYIAIGR